MPCRRDVSRWWALTAWVVQLQGVVKVPSKTWTQICQYLPRLSPPHYSTLCPPTPLHYSTSRPPCSSGSFTELTAAASSSSSSSVSASWLMGGGGVEEKCLVVRTPSDFWYFSHYRWVDWLTVSVIWGLTKDASSRHFPPQETWTTIVTCFTLVSLLEVEMKPLLC